MKPDSVTAHTHIEYEWVTRHELMLRHKGYKYDSGKNHVEKLLTHACAKTMPGIPNEKSLKLYRVYKEHTECKREENTVTQTGSGKITATGAAATEFVEGAVHHHNKRADIHEWYTDKELTDIDGADPDDGTAPPEHNLKQTKQNNKRKSPKPDDDDAEQPQPKKQKTAEQEMGSHGPTRP